MKTWNRVKKGLAFITAMAILFALAACQQDGASSNAPPAGSQSPEISSSSGVVHEVSTDPGHTDCIFHAISIYYLWDRR